MSLHEFMNCFPAHRMAISTAARFGDAVDAAVAAVSSREAAQIALVDGMDGRIRDIAGLTTEAVATVRARAGGCSLVSPAQLTRGHGGGV